MNDNSVIVKKHPDLSQSAGKVFFPPQLQKNK